MAAIARKLIYSVCLLVTFGAATGKATLKCGWVNQEEAQEEKSCFSLCKTPYNKYPMIARVEDAEEEKLLCGGTIITRRHVLTAAECPYLHTSEKLLVRVGDWGRTTGEGSATELLRELHLVIVKSIPSSKRHGLLLCTAGNGTNNLGCDFSGGPLLWQDPKTNRSSLMGISHYNYSNIAYEKTFMDVTYHIDAISAIVKESAKWETILFDDGP